MIYNMLAALDRPLPGTLAKDGSPSGSNQKPKPTTSPDVLYWDLRIASDRRGGGFLILETRGSVRIYKCEVTMLPQPFSSYLLPILLLVSSNIFMTTAWYWHLRFRGVPLIPRNPHKLGPRLRRILLGGSGQSV